MLGFKIFIVVLGLFFMFGFGLVVGWATDALEVSRKKERWWWEWGEGWMVRPIKHFMCGALHGHVWEECTPEAGGHVGKRCRRCGKEKVFKVKRLIKEDINA